MEHCLAAMCMSRIAIKAAFDFLLIFPYSLIPTLTPPPTMQTWKSSQSLADNRYAVDREIFAVKIIGVLNFRVKNISLPDGFHNVAHIRVFYFRAFNFRHLSNWQKIFNGENFPIYGVHATNCMRGTCIHNQKLFLIIFHLIRASIQ